jgi:hypothetical protein
VAFDVAALAVSYAVGQRRESVNQLRPHPRCRRSCSDVAWSSRSVEGDSGTLGDSDVQSPDSYPDAILAAVTRRNVEELRTQMRAAEAALHRGAGTRAAWIKAFVAYYVALHPDEARWLRTDSEDSVPSVDEIRDRAMVADKARKAVPKGGRIDPDPERHDEWSARLGWFEETWSAVFTDGFRAALTGLKAGDPAGIEYAVRFLEADPWCFRSGYTKARLIPAIARFELDESMRQRLARVVLAVVDDPRRRREIREYGTLARVAATANLRAQLEERAAATDPQVQFNARQVLERLGGST